MLAEVPSGDHYFPHFTLLLHTLTSSRLGFTLCSSTANVCDWQMKYYRRRPAWLVTTHTSHLSDQHYPEVLLLATYLSLLLCGRRDRATGENLILSLVPSPQQLWNSSARFITVYDGDTAHVVTRPLPASRHYYCERLFGLRKRGGCREL